MRKSLIKVMFFGALAFATSASFVGCKDYDDDIDNLQGQIDKIASSLTDLQAKVGTYVKSVTYDAATGKLTVVNGENSVTYTIAPNLPTYTISVDKDGKVSLLKDGTVVSSGTITFPTPPVPPTPTEAFDPSKLTVDPVTKKIMYDGKETGVTMPTDGIISIEDKKNADGVTIGYTIHYKDQAVTFALNDVLTLKGLVFKSDLFVDGIEAFEYPYLSYNYLASGTSATTSWNDDRNVICKVITAPGEWIYGGGSTAEYNPIEYINYHLNPSSAKVNKADLSFVSRDVEAISRASVALPEVADMKAADEGVLPVGFRAVGKDIKGAGEASIMALQAVVKSGDVDTLVTSDYAMLYASVVTPQAIAFNDNNLVAVDCPETNPDELFKSVKDAIENAPTLAVAYNKDLDLKELLTVHYNRAATPTATKNDGTHKVWAYGEEAKFGLKYDFAFIQYQNGTNVTSDSKYADQTAIANGVVIPRIVNADGTTLGEQGISSVGKRPLVRVRIMDDRGRVVLYAFVKIEIAKQVEDVVTDEFTRTHKFGCADADLTLTWSEISYQLLENAAVQSKDEFDALYKFDETNTVGNQYVKTSGNKFVPAAGLQILGAVKEIPDATGTTNTVLHWNLDASAQETVYEKAGHKATIYVRYISKLSTTAHAPIYMPLTATVAKPQGTVTAKLTNFWYNGGTNTRLNVQYPIDGGSTINYIVNLNQVWETSKPKFNPTTGFASYTDAIFATQNGGTNGGVVGTDGGYKYYFDAVQNKGENLVIGGTTYTLTVDNTKATCTIGGQYEATTANMNAHALLVNTGVFTNTKLYANGVQVATIDQATGNITYTNNATAKILLNAYPHTDAKYFAQIGICAYSPCGVAMSLTNNSYPAYFIRPIDAIGAEGGEFIDAQANASTLEIAKLFNFQDWRDVKFVDGSNYDNTWLYAFYGLNNVKVNLAKITTDLSNGTLGTTLLSSKTSDIKLTQVTEAGAPVAASGATLNFSTYNNEASGTSATYDAIVAAMGKIKYENNGNNVQTFKVRIPVEFTYTWGTIATSVDCTVKGTMGN